MIASSQKHCPGPRDGRSVLHQRAVHQLDAPTFPLDRGLNLHRLEQHRAQQVDREPGGLKLGIDTGSLYPPTQQAADDLAAHCRTPRSSGHHARQIGVPIDSEERLGHDGGILDRHQYHDRTPDRKDRQACSDRNSQ
jgi:hypothetical protein